MHDFNYFFKGDSDIDSPTLEALLKQVKTIRVKKGDVLQQRGDEQKHAYFVKQGLLRSFSIDQKGKEHIFMFAPEGWIISDIQSTAVYSSAALYIDALEDAEIQLIRDDLFEELVQNHIGSHPDFARLELNRLLRRIGVLQKRVLMLMSASAKERYQEFTATYPSIQRRVSQKMIASYLGITPEALSRIRVGLIKSERSLSEKG